MSRTTQLYIKVSNKYQEVDLFDDIVIPLTFKVTDIRNFGSKTSGYSLDFDIPHTNNNAILFGLNSEIDTYESTFEVGKDYPAYITTNSLTIFSGNFRLKKVIKKNRGTYIYYVGNLYGGAKTFVEQLGTDKLIGNEDPSKDLDFSEYSVPANEMTLQDFYYYLQTHYTDGTGWALTLLDKTNKAAQPFSGGSQTWYTDECTPYLYAREIFDKLFYGTGYTYVSEFLKGVDFSTYLHDSRWANGIGKYDVNSLIYPYMRHNSTLHNPEAVSSKIEQIFPNVTCKLAEAYTQSDYIYAHIEYLSDLKNVVNFPTDKYTLTENGVTSTQTAYKFVCPLHGNYKIKISFPFTAKSKFAQFDYNSTSERWEFARQLTSGEVAKINTSQMADTNYSYGVYIRKNSTTIASAGIPTTACGGQYTLDSNDSVTFGSSSIDYNSVITLNVGDVITINTWFQIKVMYLYYTSETSYYTNTMFYTPSGSNTNKVIYPYPFTVEMGSSTDDVIVDIERQEGFYEESPFDPTAILNPNTTKIDYFNNFVKMFNLYVEDVSGKVNYKTGGIYAPNTLRIEPYQIYYTPELGTGQTNLKDWTDKIDWESVEYRRCDDYLYNIQNFTKAQDKDFYNENYNNTFVKPYGNRQVKGIYCTSNDVNNIDLKVSSNMCGVVNNATDVLQCPKVFALDKSSNIDTKKEYSDGIFFIWRNKMNENTDLSTNYTIKLQSRLSSSYYNVRDYYTADTLNKGYGLDDANLNWGSTEAYYQNMKGTIPTYNDLYSAFYKLQYEEYTANDCRILKGNAYLSVMDIYNIQLSDLIMVNGNTYHILSIDQWKNEKTPCTVELIKCKPNFKGTEPNDKIVFPIIDNINVMPIATETAVLQEQIKDLADEVTKYKAQTAQLQKDLESVQALQVAQNLELEVQP